MNDQREIQIELSSLAGSEDVLEIRNEILEIQFLTKELDTFTSFLI